jgi:hypothetical protein
VIWFLKTINVYPVEIHRQVVEVYSEGAANEGNVLAAQRRLN